MKELYKLLFLVLSLFFIPVSGQQKPVRNIILLIGDGMSLPQIQAAMNSKPDALNIERFKCIGFSKTHSADNYITDSGAGATAIACGEKTYNGAIAVDTDSLPLKTILEYAEEDGKSTGLIATCAITHATPASFIAHEKNRNFYENIAMDFLSTDIDIFIGGGRNYFNRRKDNLNLLDSLKNRNYDVCEQLDEIDINSDKDIVCLTDTNHPASISSGRGNMLPEATRIALEKLNKNPEGFFVMIEGSQIDWGGHANDKDYVVNEVCDFDKAVGEALQFAEKDGNTLVIVTADHETGGLTLIGGDLNQHSVTVNFSTQGHSALMVPVFAYGPGCEEFTGMYENTEIFYKMKELLIP
jgi:alkaline phosphatase